MSRFFILLAFVLVTIFVTGSLLVPPLAAAQEEVLGVHILAPEELSMAKDLINPTPQDETWHYVTIPLPLSDLDQSQKWQDFFDQAQQLQVVPLVRLVTEFKDGAWQVPNRRQIVDQIEFLSQLDWPTDQRHIIVYNEVNHAAEWGGRTDPTSYAQVLTFTSNWAHSEDKNFVVLPAALDLAAPNGPITREAFGYWRELLAYQPDIFEYVDVWNSHSYPNPGFSASPTRTGQNSLRGFEYELAFVKEASGRDLEVFITETGWVETLFTRPWLENYYTYALENIWSDPRVKGVTPFVLRGDPGPFSNFAFLDRDNQPTAQYFALQAALRNSAS